MVCAKPGNAHAVGVVSGFMRNQGKEHSEDIRWIFRYSNDHYDLKSQKIGFQGYVDVENGGGVDRRKSIYMYVYIFGGTAIC